MPEEALPEEEDKDIEFRIVYKDKRYLIPASNEKNAVKKFIRRYSGRNGVELDASFSRKGVWDVYNKGGILGSLSIREY